MKYIAIINRNANVSRLEVATALKGGGIIAVDGDTRDVIIEALPEAKYSALHLLAVLCFGAVTGIGIFILLVIR